MAEAEVYSVLADIFCEVFIRDDIVLTPDLTANDIEGWDSFKQIEIILAVEERFHIRVSSKELDRLGTVGDLISLIIRKKSD